MVTFLMKKFRKNGLSDELQLRFLQRLQRTLANGYPLLEALDTIRWDRRLANTAVQIIDMLKRGLALDEALEQTKFHPSICSYLHLSRNIGNVAESLDKCIEMFQKRCEYLRKFQQLSRYPLLLIIVFSLLLFFIKKECIAGFSGFIPNKLTSFDNCYCFIICNRLFDEFDCRGQYIRNKRYPFFGNMVKTESALKPVFVSTAPCPFIACTLE
ncbi:type II secretion system F family protein [Virgibacillus halophilus]|uniref:Type II secretion system F family protein n=1 Tax=Tigheibacillus halophilus TaxID=361280 RepID=A0ABU5CBG5_9BACI|nr:type II secretion system F family protein [Virgibacillus halophilus]